jgi:hypothetical protein
MVDITNLGYQRWLGAKVKSWLDQNPAFDGIMADNSLKYSAQEFDSCGKTRPINPRTGIYFTDAEILDGCAGTLNAIIDAIGTNKLLMPNGIWNGAIWWNSGIGDNYKHILSKVPRLNCLTSEGTFMASNSQWYSESEWKNSVDFVVWAQDNFLNGHPERHFNGGCLTWAMPSDASSEQVIKYGYCSMLLAIKYPSPQNAVSFGIDSSQTIIPVNLLQLFQKLRSADLIEPLGDYYKINSASVYARDFLRGKVFVNPTSASYMITLDGNYSTVDGNTISGSLIVYPHTGVILLK